MYKYKPVRLNMDDHAAVPSAAAAAIAGSDVSGEVAEVVEVDATAAPEVDDSLHKQQDYTYGMHLYAPTAPLDASLTALEDEVGPSSPSWHRSTAASCATHVHSLVLPVITVLAKGGTIRSPIWDVVVTSKSPVVSTLPSLDTTSVTSRGRCYTSANSIRSRL
jgi:hypothetical protein